MGHAASPLAHSHVLRPNTCLHSYWQYMRKQFHKVVVRKLTTASGRGISRTMRAELVRYQEEMLGRKFNLNLVTYMEAILAIPHREDMRTSFCSQLVAGAYKRLGLLPADRAASSYFPGDFSAKTSANLTLLAGAHLGREMTISFEHSPMLYQRASLMRTNLTPSAAASSPGVLTPTAEPLAAESNLLTSVSKGFSGSMKQMRAHMRATVTMSSPPLAPTAEDEEVQRAEAGEMLKRAMAVYTVRKYAIMWRRARERREQQQQQQQQQQTAELDVPSASVGEVRVEVRQD